MTADLPPTTDPFTGDEVLRGLRSRRRPILFLISGPSGVGKDAVAERLAMPVEQGGIPETRIVVTATTRDRRPGEQDLVHYEFLAREDFITKQDEGYFIENATVYGPGNLYGVPRHAITSAFDAGVDPIIKIDVQGVATIKQIIPQAVTIFIAPESIEALHHRLNRRNSEDYHAAVRRLRAARRELERIPGFDYVVFNETGLLDDTVAQIKAIITAERLRTTPAPAPRLDPIV